MNFKKYIPGRIKRTLKYLLGYNRERMDFLYTRSGDKIGNLQRDESIFLYGLIKVLRPKVVVEFGFLNGYSSSVILSAIGEESRLYSYDITEYSRDAASQFAKSHTNFFFHYKSQEEFDGSDIAEEFIDFVLIDASHDLEINVATFEKITPFLTDDSLIMVHDTGVWEKKFMTAEHFETLNSTENKWLDAKRVAHQINERRFINWIVENETDFVTLNFGSSAVLRHGFTLVGKKRMLET
ncbi:MAG: symbB [Flavisolibacter sp.]|nr:symbB [Flavisolibacter sp.]